MTAGPGDPFAAEVTGPVGGSRTPYGAPSAEAAAALGYVVEEYQLSGTASAYASPGGRRPPLDGRWEAAEAGQARYRTRLMVLRPADPGRFNGTVLCNWQNVSAGAEQRAPRRGEVLNGYAWVGVSAQEVGLYGMPAGMRGGRPRGEPLVEYDPSRYGDLYHPGDQGAFDIFSQAAAAVGPARSGPVDPMGGLPVRRVLALGASQSAMRLVAYANAIQPRHGLLDGFLLALWEGKAPRLEEGPVAFGVRSALRGDLGVPVVVVNSEFEALALHEVGAADGTTTRIWEVAGAPHAPARATPAGVAGSGWGPNTLSIQPVYDAALSHLQRWCAGGPAVPAQPRLRAEDTTPPRLARDEWGNAIGGIRLPEMEAPTGEYRGMSFGTGLPPLFGAYRRFADEVLTARYPSREAYEARWSAAVDALVASGALLRADAPAMKQRVAGVVLAGTAS